MRTLRKTETRLSIVGGFFKENGGEWGIRTALTSSTSKESKKFLA